MSEFLDVGERAARAAGELLQQWHGKIKAREKAPRDLVTEADLASQQLIQDLLLREFPDHAFMGEESTTDSDQPSNARYRWIVDPLDGTVNYVHGLPGYSVSIALQEANQVIAGIVFDPVSNEMYLAEAGQGARLNGQQIRTSGCVEPDQAMVAASFSANITRDSPEITRFVEMLMACQVIRRLGSAALNLCYVASGRMDGYWATSVKTWDIAGGMLILREAGGTMTSLDGGDVDLENPKFVAAATAELTGKLRCVLAQPDAAKNG